MRWAAAVEYCGGAYAGWQAQSHAVTVQGELDRVLASVAAHPLVSFCAGHTDAGVHGFQQVIHFDSDAPRTPRGWLLGSNARLPNDIALRWVQPVPAHFHARHSATGRRYRYLMLDGSARPALHHGRVAWLRQRLDPSAMHRAAQVLVGEQDFSAFRGAQCQANTPFRCVTAVSVHRHGPLVVLDIRANAFLHHMVRNISGSLIEVGQGRQPESWIAELLAGRDRTRAGMNAAPEGLYFVGPDYPAEFALPNAPEPLPGG